MIQLLAQANNCRNKLPIVRIKSEDGRLIIPALAFK